MKNVKNVAPGPRGIRTVDAGVVMLEPGEARDLALADGEEEGEWFEFDAGDKPLSDHTIAELKAIASAEAIDLGDATKKDDIIAAIELAREAA